ncbi:Ninein-like protein [Orchesella cincta]|uniref:Ninein-like protein n=1 Tax=Orchesella cincta TaxID=48709 RepID=A0A1D2N364_ORCCI|nr:Ninein-like protein [Orchesella cincta]
MEISNWESLMQASQELLRQHVVKHKEQAEKLAHSDLLMKDLWVENAKLMAALNATEQRVMHLDNLLKFHMNHHHHHPPTSPHGCPNNNNNNNAISSAPLSLPHQSSHFHI